MSWLFNSRNRGYAMGDMVSPDSPPPSLTKQFSSLIIVDGTFSYDRLSSQSLTLSIVKLDASSFHVEVAKTATVAELKQAVEAAFGHMPQKGPGKISWPLVWGQFCLCYDGQKLVTETGYLSDYGIKDGDQLHFTHHISNTCSFQRKPLKKRVVNLKHHKRSSSENKYQQKGHSDGEDVDLNDIVVENGKIQHYNAEENRIEKSRPSGFLGGLFSCTRQTIVRRARIEGSICPSTISRGIMCSFRNIRRILCCCKRQQYSRKHSWREF